MSSFATSTPKKKSLPETVSFLNTTNPEVFRVQPRRGGVLKIQDFNETFPSAIQASHSHVEESISKEFRVQTALDETQSYGSEDVTLPNPFNDAMYMLGVSVSTVMMLAAQYGRIPGKSLYWTYHCLDCVRDDFGNHPPNVQGILNQMKRLFGDVVGGQFPPDTPDDVYYDGKTGKQVGGGGGGGGGGTTSGAENERRGGAESEDIREGRGGNVANVDNALLAGGEDWRRGERTVKTKTKIKIDSVPVQNPVK